MGNKSVKGLDEIELVSRIKLDNKEFRELADTGFVSVQNFLKLGLYLKK